MRFKGELGHWLGIVFYTMLKNIFPFSFGWLNFALVVGMKIAIILIKILCVKHLHLRILKILILKELNILVYLVIIPLERVGSHFVPAGPAVTLEE